MKVTRTWRLVLAAGVLTTLIFFFTKIVVPSPVQVNDGVYLSVIQTPPPTATPAPDAGALQQVLGSLSKLLSEALGSAKGAVGSDDDDAELDESFGANNTAFRAALTSRASKDGVIILFSVDYGYLDMALNVYYSSLQRLGIANYLFVGSDTRVCPIMTKMGIACFDYIHDKDGGSSSGYFSRAFKRKTHLKTKIILEALKLNLSVLIVDVDIVFFQNPLQHMECADCDIQIQQDVIEGNSGFYLARPTNATILLHREAWKQGLAKPEISNQKAIDRKMEAMVKAKQLSVKMLSDSHFPNGKVFFEDAKRMFTGDNPCKLCVILHNNWIVSGEAKVYRFKEYGLWDVDTDGYYSSPTRKYLVYENPDDFGQKGTKAKELQSLKNALAVAKLLNRTLILPAFHCHGCAYGACKNPAKRCSFGTFFKIANFDVQFAGRYREHVFLAHSKVPAAVKGSVSPVLSMAPRPAQNSTLAGPVRVVLPTRSTVLADLAALAGAPVALADLAGAPAPAGVPAPAPASTPAPPTKTAAADGPTADEVVTWFGPSSPFAQYSVLRFQSLYGPLGRLLKDLRLKDLNGKFSRAFKSTDYRQY